MPIILGMSLSKCKVVELYEECIKNGLTPETVRSKNKEMASWTYDETVNALNSGEAEVIPYHYDTKGEKGYYYSVCTLKIASDNNQALETVGVANE